MLKLVRLRLRDLVRLIDRARQAVVYTDFEDTLEQSDVATVVISTPGVDRARFRAKLYAFLRAHEGTVVLHKLRTGKQLTALDLQQLERILTERGEFTADELADGAAEDHGLGLLIRSVVGTERAAASDALSTFVADTTLSGDQIAFVDLVITRHSRGRLGSGDL